MGKFWFGSSSSSSDIFFNREEFIKTYKLRKYIDEYPRYISRAITKFKNETPQNEASYIDHVFVYESSCSYFLTTSPYFSKIEKTSIDLNIWTEIPTIYNSQTRTFVIEFVKKSCIARGDRRNMTLPIPVNP